MFIQYFNAAELCQNANNSRSFVQTNFPWNYLQKVDKALRFHDFNLNFKLLKTSFWANRRVHMVKWTTWISKFLGNFFSNSKSSLNASPLDIAFKFISKCLALPMPYTAFSLGFWTMIMKKNTKLFVSVCFCF